MGRTGRGHARLLRVAVAFATVTLAPFGFASPAWAVGDDEPTWPPSRSLDAGQAARRSLLEAQALEILAHNRQAALERDAEAVRSAMPPPYEGTGGEAGGSVEGLTENTLAARMEVADRFDEVEFIGGFRSAGSRDPAGHPAGRAIDVMIPGDYRSEHLVGLGDAVADWAIREHERLDLKYVIWRQRVWTPENPEWRAMADRGSDNQNHYNHVHLSFRS